MYHHVPTIYRLYRKHVGRFREQTATGYSPKGTHIFPVTLAVWISFRKVWVAGQSSLKWKYILHSGKLTWQWNIPMFKRTYILKWFIFRCYVSLPECTRHEVNKHFSGPNSQVSASISNVKDWIRLSSPMRGSRNTWKQ